MKEDVTNLIIHHLFSTEEELDKARINEPTRKRILRMREIYSFWIKNPRKTDKDIVAELMERFRISQAMAYNDIKVIKICLGEFNQVSSDYLRWVFLQRCEEGFSMARKQNDPAAYAKVLASFGKYSRLDKDEGNLPDYSQIKPETFEITTNPEDAGFEKIPDLEGVTRRLLKQIDADFASAESEPEEAQEESYAPQQTE